MMAEYAPVSAHFKVLAHPTRLQILDMLRCGGSVCVCHLETALGKRQSYISQQLMILRDAGLVEAHKDGLRVFYRLVDDRTAELLSVVLGPSDTNGPAILDACPCPRCSAAVAENGLNLRR